MAKILVTGKNGQVGFELQRSLAVLGEIVAVDRDECNLSDTDAIRALIRKIKPDIIVNPAAHTAVDKAESEPELAEALNATAPAVLAEEAAKIGALLIHYSTDYVFDGRKEGCYSETDAPHPQSVYGKTKRAGEEAVIAANPRHIILRTSWVFGAHGVNFLKTILRLARERDALKIVADQFGAPTSASLLADITAQIIARYLRTKDQTTFPYGLYHLVAQGETSWQGYAQFVVDSMQRRGLEIKAKTIAPIPTSGYPLPAPRPANSRLCTSKLRETFGFVLPTWQQEVERVITLLNQ